MNNHAYTVSTCGTTKVFTAESPEQAAALMLQDRHWTSTRSIVVVSGSERLDFLDCEVVDGKLNFAERDVLP